jgi:hypothetical protein
MSAQVLALQSIHSTVTRVSGHRLQAQVEREQRIKEDVSQIMKTFYCEVGGSQQGFPQQMLPPLSCTLPGREQPQHLAAACTQVYSSCSYSTTSDLRLHGCYTQRYAAGPQPAACPWLLLQICHKQYANAMEVEQHLSSYDHHHKKVRAGGDVVCMPGS